MEAQSGLGRLILEPWRGILEQKVLSFEPWRLNMDFVGSS
jgi:hypothetical protein